ncbi:MAG: hypothetical protein NDI61_04185 [Bdellovibrionaceae bacterium]|nr:hypothetical protein [Pseudobdellovibrionaceae bacterium]
MSANEAFQTLKNYFETRPPARSALRFLREGVEIGISIGGIMDCALFQHAGLPVVEQRAARNPDIVFTIRPESIYILNSQPTETVGDMGVAILKEMLAGNINARITGNVLDVLRNGYLEILKEGGSQVTKFISTIKSLKR